MNSAVTAVLGEMLDTIPALCAEKITSEVCAFIHNDFSSDIRTRVVEYMGTITMTPEMLMALLHKIAPVYKSSVLARGGSQPGHGGKPEKSKRCSGSTNTKTRRVRGGVGVKGETPPNRLASVLKQVSSLPSLPLVSSSSSSLPVPVHSPSLSGTPSVPMSSSLAQVLEQALTNAVAKISDPIFAKVKDDLTKLFDEDKEKVTGMVREGFNRLFERIATDPRTIGIFRERFGARVDALLIGLSDPVIRSVVIENKCPTEVVRRVQNKIDLYRSLNESTGKKGGSESKSEMVTETEVQQGLRADLIAARAQIDAFLANNPEPSRKV